MVLSILIINLPILNLIVKIYIKQINVKFMFNYQGTDRNPGDRWMIRGPTEYVPPVEVEVVTKRTAIALDENEGIYVK